MEGVARDLSSALPDPAEGSADLPRLARELVAARRRRRPVPGLGHPLHKPQDPRAVRLFELARETGLSGRYVELLELVAAETCRSTGRELPINATGAIGALCCELGFPWEIVRGLGVMARALGSVGHLYEERVRPLAPTLWRYAEGYSGPPDDDPRTPGAR